MKGKKELFLSFYNASKSTYLVMKNISQWYLTHVLSLNSAENKHTHTRSFST